MRCKSLTSDFLHLTSNYSSIFLLPSNIFTTSIIHLTRERNNISDVEIQQGEVKKDILDKSIDFLFEDTCVRFRTLPNIDNSVKEDVIKYTQATLGSWKIMITQMLIDKGIKVV